MFKNLLQLYALVMCLISSIMIMITFGVMFNNVTELTLTEYKHQAHLNNFTTNEKYINYKTKLGPLDEKELQRKRLLEKDSYIENQKSNAISSLISGATWLFTGFIFFIIHWCLYRRSLKKD